ncbi:MAG: type II secretion system F family protein [Steroidobacteraceae bacterium]
MAGDWLDTVLRLAGIGCGAAAMVAAVMWWKDTRSPLVRRARERIESSLIDLGEERQIFVAGPGEEPLRRRGETTSVSAIIRYLNEAGLPLSPRLVSWLALMWLLLVGVLVVNAVDSSILRGLGLLVGCAVPVLLVMRRHSEAERALERQLPEALDVMVRALQAGKPLPACWLEMSQVLEKPIAPLCHDIYLKMQYGGELDEVLREVSGRVPSEDVRFFFTALRIQTRSGGNLVQLLRDQSELIRDRLALRGRIQAISSESRMSAWIMGLMPFLVSLMMYALSPKTMSLLWTTPAGIRMIEFGLIMQLLGVAWISRLIRIRV